MKRGDNFRPGVIMALIDLALSSSHRMENSKTQKPSTDNADFRNMVAISSQELLGNSPYPIPLFLSLDFLPSNFDKPLDPS